MKQDTYEKLSEYTVDDEERMEDEAEEYPKAGDLVIESGEYECVECGYVEVFTAGEEFPECDCMSERGWRIVESEVDGE